MMRKYVEPTTTTWERRKTFSSSESEGRLQAEARQGAPFCFAGGREHCREKKEISDLGWGSILFLPKLAIIE